MSSGPVPSVEEPDSDCRQSPTPQFRRVGVGVAGVIFLCNILPATAAVRRESAFFEAQGHSGRSFAFLMLMTGALLTILGTALLFCCWAAARRVSEVPRRQRWFAIVVGSAVFLPSASAIMQGGDRWLIPAPFLMAFASVAFSLLVFRVNLSVFSLVIVVWSFAMGVSSPGAEVAATSSEFDEGDYFQRFSEPKASENVLIIVFDEVSWHALSSDGYSVRPEFRNLAALQRESVTFSQAISPHPFSQIAIPALVSSSELDADTPPGDLPRELSELRSGRGVFNSEESPFLLAKNTPFVDCSSLACDVPESANPIWLKVVDTLAVIGRSTGGPLFRELFPPISDRYENFWSLDYRPNASSSTLSTRFMRNDKLELPVSERPWLALFHSNASHHPWVSDRRGNALAETEFGEFGGSYLPFWCTNDEFFCTAELVERARELYLNAMFRVDRDLEELFGQLDAQGLLESTIVIVTSDHGASFPISRDGRKVYGLPPEHLSALARVPLMVRFPDLEGAGTDLNFPVSPNAVVREVVRNAAEGSRAADWTLLDSPPATVVLGRTEDGPGDLFTWRPADWTAWNDLDVHESVGFLEVALSAEEQQGMRDERLEISGLEVSGGDSNFAIGRVRAEGKGCQEANTGWVKLSSGVSSRIDFEPMSEPPYRHGWLVFERESKIMVIGC